MRRETEERGTEAESVLQSGPEAERGSAAVLGPAVLGWEVCGGGHPRSTSPAGNALCPPSVAAGADRALR